MMTALRINRLELEQQASTIKLTRSTRSGSSSLSASDDTIPGMIPCASIHSYSESDEDLLSLCSARASSPSTMTITRSQSQKSPSSPRSIFGNYWSSPTYKNSLGKGDEDEVIARLQNLQLPLMGSSSSAAKIIQASIICSVDQKATATPPHAHSPPMRSRRQILPTPPPSTAISSSLIMPRKQPMMFAPPITGSRKWSSAPVLLKTGPHPSILREARYSCSAFVASSEVASTSSGRTGSSRQLHHSMRNNGYNDLHLPTAAGSRGRPRATSDPTGLKKSVSFYSHVSVFEFAVPADQQKSQRGWSKYFA